ncbi:MAG: cell division protein FtsQ/DivIB [Holosporales bacterium]|jgi:cell division protein FtsQ|nr:cell division protein FtsQ/DivIB [Holosporales bacterium]
MKAAKKTKTKTKKGGYPLGGGAYAIEGVYALVAALFRPVRAMVVFLTSKAGRLFFFACLVCAACISLSHEETLGAFSNVGEKIAQKFLELTQKAGFQLMDVTVFGRHRTTKQEILKAMQVQFGESIFKYDVAKIHEQLKNLVWVKDVRVHRSLCGRIYVYIIEKVPIAIYHQTNLADGATNTEKVRHDVKPPSAKAADKQGRADKGKQGRADKGKQDSLAKSFFLVDEDGELINSEILPCFRGLPVLSGQNAAKNASAILEKFKLFPNVRAELTAMAFIQERRWNIKLNNSVEVKLPEQDVEEALKVLSVLMRHGQLSSGDIVYIDLRIPGKVVLGLSKTGKNFFKYIFGAQKS